MSIINHNLLIATTRSDGHVQALMRWLSDLNPKEQKAIVMVGPAINNYVSFLILPDGSNEGWDASNWFDELREKFIKRLEEDTYYDGSSPWKWVEVGYGEYGQALIQGNNENIYSDKYYEGDLPESKLRIPLVDKSHLN